MRRKNGYAVILAGGGAKGAYQVGALRALEEEDIPVIAVAGASVGSLNAAMAAQGDLDTAERIWNSININNVVDIPQKLIRDGRLHLSKEVLTDPAILSSAWKKGLLLDSTPLKNLIKSNLNEDKIRRRGIDLGIVTINRTDLKPEEVFLSDMKKGMLEAYLLASSSLPVFKSAEIGGKKYLDGAFYDNIPFAMMKERGYRKFIIIDISGLGNNRKPDITGTETIYIKNSIDMGGILDFNPRLLQKNIRLGYLDTIRVLGKTEGMRFFYKPDFHTMKMLSSKLGSRCVLKIMGQHMGNKKANDVRQLLPREYRYWKDPLPALMECAAFSLNIPRIVLYDFNELLSIIWNRYIEFQKKEPPGEKPGIQEFFHQFRKKLKELNPDKMREEISPYEYYRAEERFSGTEKLTLEKKNLIRLFPEIPGALVFFELLKEHRNP